LRRSLASGHPRAGRIHSSRHVRIDARNEVERRAAPRLEAALVDIRDLVDEAAVAGLLRVEMACDRTADERFRQESEAGEKLEIEPLAQPLQEGVARRRRAGGEGIAELLATLTIAPPSLRSGSSVWVRKYGPFRMTRENRS